MLCNICPRRCGAERTETRGGGVCAMPAGIVAAKAMLHQWEEPVLSGTNGAGCVFFSGCNLGCVFCQNGKISHENFGKVLSPARLREIFFELIAQGAHCIDLVSPTHFTPWVLEALEDPLPVPVVWNSGGYERVETLKTLEGRVQIYLPDLKYALEKPARELSCAGDYFPVAAAAIDEMLRQVGPYRDRRRRLDEVRRHHPPPRPARPAREHQGGHRLCVRALPAAHGAFFPYEPVHTAARRERSARAAIEPRGVPRGGAVHDRLRHHGRLLSGAFQRERGVYAGL